MYTDSVKQLASQNIITKDEQLLLLNLYDKFLTKSLDQKQLKTLDNIIKGEYDRLFNEFNCDVQIYEVEDKKFYDKKLTSREMLIIENLECLIQTKQLSQQAAIIVKRIGL